MKNTNRIPVEVTHYKRAYMNIETGEIAESRWEMIRNTISNLFYYHFWSTKWEPISVVDRVSTEMLEPLM